MNYRLQAGRAGRQEGGGGEEGGEREGGREGGLVRVCVGWQGVQVPARHCPACTGLA